MIAVRGTVEPFDLSQEGRQQYRALLGRLMEAIWEKAEQPKSRPPLRLLPPLGSGVSTITSEQSQNVKGE